MIKIAIVGCGRMGVAPSQFAQSLPVFWGQVSHLQAARECDNFEIVGLVEADLERCKSLRVTYSYPVFESLSDLLSNVEVDILTIATRTPSKIDIIRKAVDAGITKFHIEKPLLNSIEEFRYLESLQSKIAVTYGTVRRYVELFKAPKMIAREFELGELTSVEVQMGKSLLYWSMTHAVDYIINTFDEPILDVRAEFEKVEVKDFVVEEDPVLIVAEIRFANGKRGLINSRIGNNFVHVFEAGEVVIENDGHGLYVIKKTAKAYPERVDLRPIDYSKSRGSTSAALRYLSRSEERKSCRKSQYDDELGLALKGHQVMFSMIESHLRGSAWVRLDEGGRVSCLNGVYNGLPS